MDELLTTQELAERLKVSQRTVDRMVQAERLPFVRVAGRGNGHRRFIWDDVVRVLRDNNDQELDCGDRGDG